LWRLRIDDGPYMDSRPGSRGVLLKETYPGSRTLLKIGNYITSTAARIPSNQVLEKAVSWRVL